MSHRSLRFCLVFCLAAAPFAAGQSSEGPARRHTKASLLAEQDAVEPGGVLRLGIRLQMEPGWHTYWRNPGDAGLPTRVKWTLPAGFEAGEIQWPWPISFGVAPVVSYGYENEVLLAVEVRAPASIATKEVRIGARVDWLECMEACLPGRAEVTITLPVRSDARPSPDAPAFAQARRRLPVRDSRWRFAAEAAEQVIVLRILPPSTGSARQARFFPTVPRLLDETKPQDQQRLAAGLRLTLARDPNGVSSERLAGVVVVDPEGPAPRAFEVDVALRPAPPPPSR